jgi:hypothetical protein
VSQIPAEVDRWRRRGADLAALAAAGRGVDVDQAGVAGVAQHGREQRPAVVHGVRRIPLAQADLPRLHVLPAVQGVDGQVPERREDTQPQMLLVRLVRAVLHVLSG